MDDLAALQAQIAELQRKESELKQKNKQAVLEELKAKMKSYGITLDELGSMDRAPRQKTVVLIKYRHPTEPTLTWTGRGKRPRWMESYITQGGTIEGLLV